MKWEKGPRSNFRDCFLQAVHPHSPKNIMSKVSILSGPKLCLPTPKTCKLLCKSVTNALFD